MLRFMVRRTLLALLTIWAISVLGFVIVQLPPGDFVDLYVEELLVGGVEDLGRSRLSESLEAALRSDFGLDQPVFVQYGKWVSKVVRGDFGLSLLYDQRITDVIGHRLLMTVILAVATILATWVMAIPIGIYTAV